MHIGRTALALLIALSVAMLPATGVVGPAAKSMDMPGMAGMTDMSGMEDMDCCPHGAIPFDKSMNGCTCMAMCALTCVSFAEAAWSPVIFPSRAAELTQAFEVNSFSSLAGSPPFRPPRV
jgi:hypothetical protein